MAGKWTDTSDEFDGLINLILSVKVQIRWWRSYLFDTRKSVGVVRVADDRTLRLRHRVPRWQLFYVSPGTYFGAPKSSGRNWLNFHQKGTWPFDKNWITRWPVRLPAKKEKVWHGCIHRRIALRRMEPFKEYSLGELHEQVSFHFVGKFGIGATLRVTRLLPER